MSISLRAEPSRSSGFRGVTSDTFHSCPLRRRPLNKTIISTTLAGIGAIALFAGTAIRSDGQVMNEVVVYRGDPLSLSSVNVAPWGSGVVKGSDKQIYMGS